jgi:tetratricopeptide (TPR) repeat protein
MALTSASQRLGSLGRAAEALEAATEAVEIRRRRRETGDLVEVRGLAISLTNLAIRLRALSQHAKATPAAQEAVDLLRVCSEQEPSHVAELAEALNGLALALIRVGQTNEALAAGLESAGIFRELRASQPDLYGRQLASALVHSARAVEDTDPDRAVALLSEAQRVCDPARSPDLAQLIATNLDAMQAVISRPGLNQP